MTMPDFIVPDYYPQFACKCGSCRHTCCQGWDISFTMPEYFRLLGVECSSELRRKLDCAFHIDHNAAPERYATISPNWLGQCPMLSEHGLCVLQKECGEQVMSGVCRYFPRSPKARYGYACACSGSCEKVLEMLYDRQEPLHLIQLPLHFDLHLPEQSQDMDAVAFWQDMRTTAVGALQYRTLNLPERLQLLTELAASLSPAPKHHNMQEMLRIARAFSPHAVEHADVLPQPHAFQELLYILDWLCEGSQSMEAPWLHCRTALQLPEGRSTWTGEDIARALEIYKAHAEGFNSAHKTWKTYYEHLLVNHVLVDDYPFLKPHESLLEKQEALCLSYAMLRFFGVMGACSEHMEALFDIHASCFHLIEHSNFDHTAPRIASRLHMDAQQVQALTQF